MKSFSAYQYLLLDIANAAGHDKLRFEDRMAWTEAHIDELEALADSVDKKDMPTYRKAVMTLRKAQQGLPTGHLIGLDAICSGIQVMSVLTGCYTGANATGLIDPDRRADAYSDTTAEMQKTLGAHFTVSRKDAKDALMTHNYGSVDVPRQLFGEDTPELKAFYEAAYKVAPGASMLINVLKDSWKPFALMHSWKLPDGFDARVKVEVAKEARIEVDELGHSTFTYLYSEVEGKAYGVSNIANMVHSVDGYILRSMHRRCNYNRQVTVNASALIEAELVRRMQGGEQDAAAFDVESKLAYYVTQYERSTLADIVILPYLDTKGVKALDTGHLEALSQVVNSMLVHKPFGLVTVHDEFRSHANHLNHVRQHYTDIMAEMADSTLLDDLLTQMYEQPMHFVKLTQGLSSHIRNSAYGLC